MKKKENPGKKLDELIRKYKQGDKTAFNELALLLFKQQSYQVALTKSEFLYLFTAEDISEMYSTAVMSSIETYAPGKGGFGGYFRLILSRAFIKEGIARLNRQSRCRVISLDEPIADDLFMSDCIQDASFESDPVRCFEYLDLESKIFGEVPPSLRQAKNIARLLAAGYTAEEVSRLKGITLNQIKNSAYSYRKWVKMVLFGSDKETK